MRIIFSNQIQIYPKGRGLIKQTVYIVEENITGDQGVSVGSVFFNKCNIILFIQSDLRAVSGSFTMWFCVVRSLYWGLCLSFHLSVAVGSFVVSVSAETGGTAVETEFRYFGCLFYNWLGKHFYGLVGWLDIHIFFVVCLETVQMCFFPRFCFGFAVHSSRKWKY